MQALEAANFSCEQEKFQITKTRMAWLRDRATFVQQVPPNWMSDEIRELEQLLKCREALEETIRAGEANDLKQIEEALMAAYDALEGK